MGGGEGEEVLPPRLSAPGRDHGGGTHLEGVLRSRANTAAPAAARNANSVEGKAARGEQLTTTRYNTGGMIMMMMVWGGGTAF